MTEMESSHGLDKIHKSFFLRPAPAPDASLPRDFCDGMEPWRRRHTMRGRCVSTLEKRIRSVTGESALGRVLSCPVLSMLAGWTNDPGPGTALLGTSLPECPEPGWVVGPDARQHTDETTRSLVLCVARGGRGIGRT